MVKLTKFVNKDSSRTKLGFVGCAVALSNSQLFYTGIAVARASEFHSRKSFESEIQASALIKDVPVFNHATYLEVIKASDTILFALSTPDAEDKAKLWLALSYARRLKKSYSLVHY